MGNELRTGVFVCHCGINIAGVLDIDNLCEYAETLPTVVAVKPNLFTCAETGITEIKKAIQENDLNRVVVAACTPRTHEPIFRASCQEAGIDPYFFEMVNIREHCSWVIDDPRHATEKAKGMVTAAVHRVRHHEPLMTRPVEMTQSALVVGAGIAGIG